MKLRMGFVSNSSSASFLICWRHKTYRPQEKNNMSVKTAIKELFKNKFLDDDIRFKETKEEIAAFAKFIHGKTVRKEDAWFETKECILMMNTLEDFDSRMLKFVTYLSLAHDDFEFYTQVVSDEE